MSNQIITTVTDATEDQKGVAVKGGGGGGGISTINNLPPDSSGNFRVQGDDFTGITVRESEYPGKTLQILAKEATEYQRGVIRKASNTATIEGEESNYCVTPTSLKAKLGDQTKGKFAQAKGIRDPIQWVDLPKSEYSPLPLVKFNTHIQLKTNHAHALVSEDVTDVLICDLPIRGSFSEGDIIECDDVSGYNFKIIVSGDTLLRIDDTLISDIDEKYLISGGRGSSIKLRALNGQLWYVVRRDRVTIGADNV